jgi:glycosyltransferase involved in cell wall biosynthesis
MERSLVRLLQRLSAERDNHVVCTLRERGPLGEDLPRGVPLESLNVAGRDRRVALRLARVIRKYKPDVVHARNWNTWPDAVLACHLARSVSPDLVLGFHGLETQNGFSIKQRRLARWLRLSKRKFTTVSHAGKEQLTAQLAIPPDRIDVLLNGVDTEKFVPAEPHQRRIARDALGIGENEIAVATVGSLVQVKNHAMLLNSWRRCASNAAPARLLVVGDGPLRLSLQDTANDSPRVDWLGSRSDVLPVLHAADAFVLPSNYEQMSNALLEAMSCGLPVIATDVGDNRLIIEHDRSGFVVPVNDPIAMAHALQKMIDDPARRRRLGQAARDRVAEHYDFDSTVARYDRYYETYAPRVCERYEPCAV